jgi:hypothetical protein
MPLASPSMTCASPISAVEGPWLRVCWTSQWCRPNMAKKEEAVSETAAAGRRASAKMDGFLLARRIKAEVPDLAWGLYSSGSWVWACLFECQLSLCAACSCTRAHMNAVEEAKLLGHRTSNKMHTGIVRVDPN